jgi:membrane protein implicated in regulation of membrane protease activity
MDAEASTIWWLAAGALVAAELATGTFYLLMIALGCVAGAVAAHAAFGQTAQFVAAAIVAAGATTALHLRRRGRVSPPAGADRDVVLDIGQTVDVEHWDAEGGARVQYRGAAWSVAYAGEGTPRPGRHVIVAVDGSRLRVAPAAS